MSGWKGWILGFGRQTTACSSLYHPAYWHDGDHVALHDTITELLSHQDHLALASQKAAMWE